MYVAARLPRRGQACLLLLQHPEPGNYYISSGNSWRDDISSIWNHQTGGVVSYFYDWKGLGYVRVGSLSAGNYLQDLTRDRAADGGNWNDRIDQVAVC